jgi:sugar/nucleoside kinase (ribokinase family)
VIESFGAARFAARLERIAPDLVFATEAERAALPPGALQAATSWVVKRGAGGIVVDGLELPALPAEVLDTTGAGDALAAGYLVGGDDLALQAAARCIASAGAMPRNDVSPWLALAWHLTGTRLAPDWHLTGT